MAATLALVVVWILHRQMARSVAVLPSAAVQLRATLRALSACRAARQLPALQVVLVCLRARARLVQRAPLQSRLAHRAAQRAPAVPSVLTVATARVRVALLMQLLEHHLPLLVDWRSSMLVSVAPSRPVVMWRCHRDPRAAPLEPVASCVSMPVLVAVVVTWALRQAKAAHQRVATSLLSAVAVQLPRVGMCPSVPRMVVRAARVVLCR